MTNDIRSGATKAGRDAHLDALRTEIQNTLIGDVLIGGNHLASSLLAAKCYPDLQADYHSVLSSFGQPCADMWVAWKAIMDLSKWRRMEGIDP